MRSFAPDRGKAIAAVIADALREARLVGREHQVRPLVDDELLGVGKAQDAVDDEHVIVGHQLELVDDEVAQILGHRGFDLSGSRVPRRRRLSAVSNSADQVLGLFLDLDVAVAQQPESAAAVDLEAREQQVDEAPTITCSMRATKRWPPPGQADEPLDLRGKAARGRSSGSASGARARQRRPEPRFGMNGNGCAGSIASGVSTGSASSMKRCAQPVELALELQLEQARRRHAAPAARPELVPAALLRRASGRPRAG